MIKLNSIRKVYNKNKTNEIKAINDCTLELPDRGMIALLGKSGSGKTTLLNVLSGLDRYDTGNISIKGKNIRRYKPSVWDKMRCRDIGYIFQNYCLLEDKTVYENLELSLQLAGFTETDTIDDRITYALSLVGMAKYKKRKPNTLSGGQQQRVAIARAIVKGPSIIIADEPTGNLDSDNTFEVMDILKSISLTRLVVLVTHEEEIAGFFADRIIRLRDGVIVEDVVNSSDKDISIINNKNIFLKDLPYSSNTETDNFSIRFNGDSNSKYDLHIIEKGGKIFINARNSPVPVILLDNSSETKVLEDNISVKSKVTHKTKELNLTALAPVTNPSKYSYKDLFKSIFNVWQKYMNSPKKNKRINKAILFVLSIAILISVFYISSNIKFNEDSYTYNRNVVLLSSNHYYVDFYQIKTIEEHTSVDTVILSQGSFVYSDFYNYIFPFDFIIKCDIYPEHCMDAESKIIYGKGTLDNEREIIIDKKTADRITSEMSGAGIRKAESIINESIKYGIYSFTIVGVIDGGFDGGYITDDAFQYLSNSQYAYNQETMPYKVLLNRNDDTNDIKFIGYTYLDEYQVLKDSFEAKRKFQLPFNIGFSAVCFMIMLTITSQTIKAKIINRIKEIGIYRCIGVSRFSILKDYLLETLFLLCSSTLIGLAIAAAVLDYLSLIIIQANPNLVFSFFIPILAFILIFTSNIMLTMYIVMSLLRHTPAEIMAKYDI